MTELPYLPATPVWDNPTFSDCPHNTLIHLPDSPLWECEGCEGQLNIDAWHALKGESR